MKRPYYYLKEDVVHRTESGQEFVFKSGTLVTPIMDDRYLSGSLKDEIETINRFEKTKKYVMCMLGIFWIPVELEKIKEVI